MFDYEKYYLKDNPFPGTAAIDLTDPDPRMNGTIFQDQIFTKELVDLQNKTDRRVNMVYISGSQHDRGVGKSALLIHHWRKCLQIPDSTTVYIKLEEKDKPKDICRKILRTWHDTGTLWKMFQSQFLNYCNEQTNPMLRRDSVQFLFEKHPRLCPSLPLTLYTQIRDAAALADQFTKHLESKTKNKLEHCEQLYQKYLTEPTSYLEVINKSGTDTVGVFENLIKIFQEHGVKQHYIFMDQFEDLITGSSKSGIAKLSLELKNILLAGARKTSFFVTLHPNSEMLLQGMEAKDLTGIAPFNTIHRVNVMVLDRKGDQAIKLATAYMDHYRTETPPYPTYPIKNELINFLSFLENGNIRALLQNLYNCIEYASMEEIDEITLDYALRYPQEILGREVNQKQIDRFKTRKNKPNHR